ncbi:MAG: GntR family transcriptional regulator [Gammaproteobacteria bacterium]
MTNITQKLLHAYKSDVLDPNSPTPLYHQLYIMLRDCIVGGILPDGTKMPSEKELATTFNVSRITARRALHDLAEQNLVARHRGRGTFVNYKYRPEPVNAPLIGVLESLEHMGRETRIKVLSLRFNKPPAFISEEFEVDAGHPLCHIIRVRSNQSMPFAYYESWSTGLNKSITRQVLEKTPRLELIRKAGIKIARVEQTLSAEAADPAAADALGIMPGKPLLKLIRRAFDKKGKQVDYIDGVYNPERFQYQMTLTPNKTKKSR